MFLHLFIQTNIFILFVISFDFLFSFPYWAAFPASALGFIAICFTSGVAVWIIIIIIIIIITIIIIIYPRAPAGKASQ